MNVIPFVRRQPRARDGVVITVRRDLRTGLPAAGVVRAENEALDPVAALTVARALWRETGMTAPLAIALPAHAVGDAAATGDFTAALLAAGFSPRSVDVEVDERALPGSLAAIERLRARGFGVALQADPACPLPFGQRTRSLFTELVMPAPTRLDPFMGLDADDARPLARRMFAARAQGIVITATGIGDAGWAKALAAAGFDRGEGPYAP